MIRERKLLSAEGAWKGNDKASLLYQHIKPLIDHGFKFIHCSYDIMG
ncbi:Uncharacterized protein APZ42_001870 [Daphnia magna]|uniref:Uncharacterized protein n=1 Tax=Daphnia magna TaxID=35525 RepID=A0A164IP22_9CRUS|nr:Uncharacterized protein APZ42_001870 [Daphnia magna]